VQVVRVEARLLGRALEEELGVMDDVLVDRGARGDEDRDARLQPPARPADLLPGRGHGPWIAGEDGRVQPADVDAQLEGVGRDDAEDLPVTQALLDGAAFGGQVAAPIAAHARAGSVALAQGLAQAGQEDLDRDPRPPEHDRLAAGPQERQGPALGEGLRRRPRAAGRFHDRRIHEQDVALARRCAVAVDEARGSPGEHLGELRGVPDRRGAAHDDRMAAVMRTDAQQPAQDVGDVAPEHAAVRVQLVDDDELELLEQLEPLGVVGEDGRVEHVRVAHDDLAGGADGGPDGRGRVAVVRRRDDREPGRGRQLAELGHLVLAEGLGREQEQRPSGGVVRDGLQGGEGIAQRLAGGRRRHDDDVLAGMDRVDGLGLVAVELLDATTGQTPDDARVQPVRHRGEGRRSRRDHRMVGHTPGQRRLLEKARQDGRGIGGGISAHAGHPQTEPNVRSEWTAV
jgi:hypothetical protein